MLIGLTGEGGILAGRNVMGKREKRRRKIIEATLELAAERAWRAITLTDIADRAGLSLADLRREFAAKRDILAAFVRLVDDEVLKKADPSLAEEPAKERLFDVIMTRFEVMQPFKAGIRRLSQDAAAAPSVVVGLLPGFVSSQYWMLTAAGISAEGPGGLYRLPAMMGLYSRVFAVWLEDDDPGLTKTMAALDRRLSRAARWSRRVDGVLEGLGDLFCAFVPSGLCRSQQDAPGPAASQNGGRDGKDVLTVAEA